MENSNDLNKINGKNQKEINISSKGENEENFSEIKMSLKDFPTLNTLYNNNSNIFNSLSQSKKVSKEEKKQNDNYTKAKKNKLLLDEKNTYKTQIKFGTNKNKNNTNKNLNNKNDSKQKKKKHNYIKEINNKNDILKSIPKNIKKDSLVKVITVREAKEMAKGNINIKSINKNNVQKQPQIKKFENIEIKHVNNEAINIEPKSRIFSNVEFIHQFDNKIVSITNRRFKNLEMKKESEEKIKMNKIKKFENIDIFHSENDLHFIDIKKVNNEVNNTISENITYENIEGEILSKNGVKNSNFEQNNKKFMNLEIIKSDNQMYINENKTNIKESIPNIEENKDENNINNNNENILSLNNLNIQNNEKN